MNVAALLQDSPSEDTNNRRRPPENPSQRTWPPPSSSPPLQQPPPPPSSTSSSTWGPTSSSGIHDRPPTTHWQGRDRALSNPNLVGPGTGVPPSPYLHSDEKREREQRDRADMDIIRAVASSRPTPHAHHHVHTHQQQQQVPMAVQPVQPQKQFQHQFHTQFVSGLTVGNGSPSPNVDTGGSGNKKERDGRRSGGRDKEKERERERERERDRGLGRERELGRDRDRDRERERDREIGRDRDRERERDREMARDRDRDRDARRERELGGSTEYPGPPGYDHRHVIPQHHPPHHQYRIPPPLPPPPPPPPPLQQQSHSHPHQPNHHQLPQPPPHQLPPNQQSSPDLTGLGPVGNGNVSNDNPPSINLSPTAIDDWDLDIAIEEEGRSWNRARVGVHLGTFVFPKLPFPYFFELGSGLVGSKERDEERERVREENERKEREIEEERERENEKKKANGEKEIENDDITMKIEEGEIIEKKVVDKEVDKTSDSEKKDRGIKIQLQKDDSKDSSFIPVQGKIDSPVSVQLEQQDSQLPQRPLLDIETRTTIIIPTGYIPVEKPLRPKLWGGGGFDPRPRPPPLRTRRSKNGGLNGKGKHQQQLQLQSRPSSTKPSLLSANSANTSLNSSSSSNPANNSNINLALPTSSAPTSSSKLQIRTRRPRRIYTDDSDIFLCAIHSGWVTWSGARKARLKGRDMRIEVRMLRCAGAGGENESLGGESGGGEGGERERRVEEEMIGRFVGGYGERCFNPLGKSGRVAGEEGSGGGGGGVDDEEEEEEVEEEGGLMLDDPDDDGRSLVSAAWGSGHDGSAIEIVNVEFVEKGTARSACGLGRRNRSQRLLEYAERRASIFGYPCTPTLSRLAGRKRRRGWDACSWPVHHPRRIPNATVLDIIQEVEEEEGEGADDHLGLGLRVEEEDKLMDIRTMVFGMGVSGDLRVGYKYVPNVLKEILFPSPRSSSADQPPPRKRRRRTQETEDVEMENTDNNNVTPTSSVGDTLRPVILETVKESYLLSPSILSSSVDAQQTYDIALILEAEVVVEEEPPLVESEPRNAVLDDITSSSPTKLFHDLSTTTTTTEKAESTTTVSPQSSKTTVRNSKPLEEILPPSSPPTDILTLEDETAKPQFAVQVLQRNLTRDMFRFVNEGVYVKEDGGGGGGMETQEWVIQVKDWKWAPKSLSSKERII